MSEKIGPVLSPEEWERIRRTTGLWEPRSVVRDDTRMIAADQPAIGEDEVSAAVLLIDNPSDRDSLCEVNPAAVPALIAALNDRLSDDDPRKITRERVNALRAENTDPSLDPFIDALESYLPPA